MSLTRVLISNLLPHTGSEVTVMGWIARVRDLKNVQFLVVRDNTGVVQVTNALDQGPNALSEIIKNLTPESTVAITGTVTTNEKVRQGGIEIIPREIKVFSLCEPQLPVQPSSELDKRMDWRNIDLRRPENLLIFRVQTLMEQAMREFWTQRGFIEIHSPKLMGSASEGGAELFKVEYFGGTACLAQSPQFYKQMAMGAGFDNVFEIGPVFRANPSFTSRHDTEFTSVDVEMSWIDSHDDVMGFEEVWLQYVLNRVANVYGEAIQKTFKVEVKVPTLPFPRVTMAEAMKIMALRKHVIPLNYGGDLDPDGERLLCQHIAQQTGHEFVFVTDYPVSVRPFYHMRHEGQPDITKSFDLLWKGLEVTSGAQREHRYEALLNQTIEKGVTPDSIRFYLDFFRYGMPPHGGFGLGLTRALMVLFELKNVREVTYLYRGPNRLTP